MDYVFIFDAESKGWWLKIDSINKLSDYHEKTGSSRYEEAMSMYLKEGHPSEILEKLNPAERIAKMQDRNFKRLQAAVIQAERNGGNILNGFRCLNIEIGMNQLRQLEEEGAIYINSVGGYTTGLKYSQFCHRKELVFPNFVESEIRIKRFNNGTHYYAYIGDMQVRDVDRLKWDSFDEAYKQAVSLVRGCR